MKLIEQSSSIIVITPNIEQIIEQAGRTCYKSESNITKNLVFSLLIIY